MKTKTFIALAALLALVQGAWGWEGSGTSTAPYLIKTSADWKQLADDVSGGNSYSGKFFEMTADIDAQGISVGSASQPFSGTFSGGLFTLTYDRGGAKETGFEFADDYCAPFVRLDGATIRYLTVKGSVYSKHQYAAGIASIVSGSKPTTLLGCHVSSILDASADVKTDASFGGLVGMVDESCTGGATLRDCTFTGAVTMFSVKSGGMVGYACQPVSLEHCLFDPKEVGNNDGSATFARMAEGIQCSLKQCYYTRVFGQEQGEAVFNKLSVPDGCTATFVSESTVSFNGVQYWQNGATIELTAPDDVAFDHWTSNTNGCYLSNPWQRSGVQVVRDVQSSPILSIETTSPTPRQERTMDGTRYRYLSLSDYHLYLSDEWCRQKGFYLNSDGWLVKKVNDKEIFVTIVTGWDKGGIPSDGAQIHNDLSGFVHDYTLMACIAPSAFNGCTELKTLYFKDSDANAYNAQTPFDFIIGDKAFANCPNLTEVKMMQYTTEGTNHWEALRPEQVSYVGSNVLENSPSANFSTDASQYQAYMGSEVWEALRKNIIVYNHTFSSNSFEVNGAKYNLFYSTEGKPIKNNDDGHKAIMDQLRLWNADYQQFNVAQVLTGSSENVWYSQVLDADNDYLRSHNGVMRIYNDAGSYYNYKTIAIKSLGGSKEVRAIEFWQTNGRSSNSYTDPKMVIMNDAFKGCDNLKELRLFYYVEDGEDRWTALGPKDVIPGDNIFGLKKHTDAELANPNYNFDNDPLMPEGFKILVSPDYYLDFLDDPNWMRYTSYIEPVDYSPSQLKDFTSGGLTYSYMTNPGGILQTSQVVSQDVSWWTAPRIAAEVLMYIAAYGTWKSIPTEEEGQEILGGAINQVRKASEVSAFSNQATANCKMITEAEAEFGVSANTWGGHYESAIRGLKSLNGFSVLDFSKYGSIPPQNVGYETMTRLGLINKDGIIVTTNATLALDKVSEEEAIRIARYMHKPLSNMLSSAKKAADDAANLLLSTNELQDMWLEKNAWLHFRRDYFPSASRVLANGAAISTTAGMITAAAWGGTGTFNEELMRKGMRNNLLANIHEVNVVGNSYVITTPSKNIIYHTYVKDVAPETTDAVIYAGFDNDNNSNTSNRTMTFARKAFRNHKKLQRVRFHAMEGQTSNAAMSMLFTIPDSAFVGCDNLTEFSTLLQDNEEGTRALGPENFVLAGDSIFAGLDSTRFHIVIDPLRKEDFLLNESWAPLKRYFVYQEAKPKSKFSVYAAQYAYSYEGNAIKREHKVSGHLIEHTIVNGANNEWLSKYNGQATLYNDIGQWNNYQLDAIAPWAFQGNTLLRTVQFTDIHESITEGPVTGDVYTGLEMALQDSCFAKCPNLETVDLIYAINDGTNHIVPMTTNMVKIGKGVLEGSPKARLKMMTEQKEWFEADSAWTEYKDRFLPVVFKPSDKAIRRALNKLEYVVNDNQYDHGYDYLDLTRLPKDAAGGYNFTWLDGKFSEQGDDILTFPDFKLFEHIGLDYVGRQWFSGCSQMSNIFLPSTIKTIRERAFNGCSKLQEIELPSTTSKIEDGAFEGCGILNTIVVRNTTPAELGKDVFAKHEGLKIYVPAQSLNAYLTAWSDYKDYIVSDASYKTNKVVTVTEMGTLADKLGLNVEWNNSGAMAGDEPRYIHGNYSKYDSLTVSGPLNNLDLWVIRYLAGNSGYEKGGIATDGKLRYLNLHNADIRKDKDCKAHYLNLSILISNGWMAVQNDNELPRQLFKDCTSLQTVVLPKSITAIASGIFKGCTALKRLAMTGALSEYSGSEFLTDDMIAQPLDELVLLTEKYFLAKRTVPWGQAIQAVYSTKECVGDYLSEPKLLEQAQSISAPFEDDGVWKRLTDSGHFFPSEFTELEDVGTIFSEKDATWKDMTTFDEFSSFYKVKQLHGTFSYDTGLQRVTLPSSVELIDEDVFAGCRNLETITMESDSVPRLIGDPFQSLPDNYVIYVPRHVVKAYRTKWPKYADHINPSSPLTAVDRILVVDVLKPNTLAEELGLQATREASIGNWAIKVLTGVRGDYSQITRLKVNGPLGGSDLDLLRHLAGYCPWANTPNFAGMLQYLDLYDARIMTDTECALQGYARRWDGTTTSAVINVNADEVPQHAFLRAYHLKTLILPRSCKKVNSRALQECEGLETLVVGDDMEDFNWNALDDDAMLTRMYILAKKKMNISTELAVWRWLCNNYNPTFDAFYVRPSQYEEYLKDDAYTGSSWQRTNNVSKGVFEEDDAFAAFASHAAATPDELIGIKSVDGWFDAHPGVKDLTPLQYTLVDSLSKATLAPLTQLEKVAMPITLAGMEDNLFESAKRLRYVDFLFCDSTDIVSGLRNGGFKRLGIDTQQTLAYVPATYGDTNETNVVVASGSSAAGLSLRAKTYRMVDSLDYVVPYAFATDSVKNARALAASSIPYTICVPYKMNVPQYARAYKLSARDGSLLVFEEVTGQLEAMVPYLLKVVGNKRYRKMSTTLDTDIAQTIPASGPTTYGRQVDAPGYSIRGSFVGISNADAAAMGAYVLQTDGDWHPVTTAQSQVALRPFRAFLLPSARNASTRIAMSLVDDATAIDSIETIDQDGTHRYYDLNGRELPGKPAKGMYIYNGKKHTSK